MDRLGRRTLGGIGGGLQLLATLLPFFSRGSLLNEDLETLSLLAVSPWLGMASVTLGLACIALAVSHNSSWQWVPIVGTLAVMTLGLTIFRPFDYGTGIGIWAFLGVLAMVTIAAAWRRPSPSGTQPSP